MRRASAAATALAIGQPIHEQRSSLKEANTVLAALERASTELAEQAAQQQLLLHELSHRVKNILAVVQAIVRRSFSEGRSMSEAGELLVERLHALARAHDLLIQTNWKGADLKQIVEAELQPFAARTTASGPEIIIDAKMVQTIALVLHELTTNAAKYGSLSSDVGKVAVTWSVRGNGSDARLHFCWQEHDGPPVTQPKYKGFGSSLLERAFAAQQDVQAILRYDPAGVVYEIDAPLSVVARRSSQSQTVAEQSG